MKPALSEFSLSNLILIQGSSHFDARGQFRSVYKANDSNYKQAWGDRPISQVNISANKAIGQIRGLHYQSCRNSEAKLITCIRGRVWDVAVDMRDNSTTKYKWCGIELDSASGNAILIPEGFAHGFQTLESNSELLYLHSGNWIKDSEVGVRFDDPLLSIKWPLAPVGLSDRDLSFPFLET